MSILFVSDDVMCDAWQAGQGRASGWHKMAALVAWLACLLPGLAWPCGAVVPEQLTSLRTNYTHALIYIFHNTTCCNVINFHPRQRKFNFNFQFVFVPTCSFIRQTLRSMVIRKLLREGDISTLFHTSWGISKMVYFVQKYKTQNSRWSGSRHL